MSAARDVGRVVGLWRYPVKSMAAEPLHRVDVSWNGLAGDRRYAFVRDGLERSGFPWLTIRERSEMWRFQPTFVDPTEPDTSVTMVRTPSGTELDVIDPALAVELGGGARVIKQGRGIFDTAPLSLITTQTVRAIAALAGYGLEPLRFRPNLLVEGLSDEPYAEDAWVGSTLRVGGMRMRVDKRDQRCVMVNVDPETCERDAVILRAIAQNRESCLGVYGTTVEPGVVALGDPVGLER